MAPETGRTPPLTAVERALRSSLLVSEFRDVHLYAFSRRSILPEGTLKISHPVPVVVISSILKNTESFSNLLAAPDTVRQHHTHSSEYDYESDSDLDEFEELRVEDLDACPAAGPGPSSAGGLLSEGELEDRSMALENGQDAVEEPAIAATKRYLEVPVSNVAYRTLHACVFYLYTGKINFLPLTSHGMVGRHQAIFATSNDLAPPACSPKSTYRLAELYGLTELRDLAYNEITSQLSPENILEEAFSSFFVRYDRLREHAVSYLSQNYSKPAIQQSLPNIIQRIALGGMPHARGVLRSLLRLPVAISPPTTGHHVSHSRVIRRSHSQASKSLPPSIFKREEAVQPAIGSTSLRVASDPDPLPPTESSGFATASGHVPCSSSLGPSAGSPELVNQEAVSVASEAGPAEMTVVAPEAAGDDESGEPTPVQAPDNMVQLSTPDAGRSNQSTAEAETSSSKKLRMKARKKKMKKSTRAEDILTNQATSTTSWTASSSNTLGFPTSAVSVHADRAHDVDRHPARLARVERQPELDEPRDRRAVTVMRAWPRPSENASMSTSPNGGSSMEMWTLMEMLRGFTDPAIGRGAR